MNLNNQIYISSNQINDCIIIGIDKGFKIYYTDPFKINFERLLGISINIIKMLYKTNIVLYVSNKNLNELVLWDDMERKIVGKILLNNKIINFELNREIIVIATEYTICIYKFNNNITLIKKIKTIRNPKGIFALQQNLISYPDVEKGYISIIKYNGSDINYYKKIQCHLNYIQLITFNKNGELIATCSEKGTIIRIYNINDGKLVKELRRGINPVKITELKFNSDSKLIFCNSNRKTIHIYDISAQSNYYFPEYSSTRIYNESLYSVFLQNDDILSLSYNKYYIYSKENNYELKIDKLY
jgi:WD40 repeat protein